MTYFSTVSKTENKRRKIYMKKKEEDLDPFVLKYNPSELKIAAEFLTTWLPFLTRNLCHNCTQSISNRVLSLDPEFSGEIEQSLQLKEILCDCDRDGESSDTNSNSLGSWKDGANGFLEQVSTISRTTTGVAAGEAADSSSSVRMSWADMAQEEEEEEEDQLAEEEDVGRQEQQQVKEENKRVLALDQERKVKVEGEKKRSDSSSLTREQREYLRFKNVVRNKEFTCLERINGKIVNILAGLELHTGVFSAAEQKRIVEFIYILQEKGRRGELRERTFSAPQKWMRGKGRETIQFGCCYNYAVLKDGRPPGIIRDELVDPIPPLFKVIIRRLVGWHVLPPSCVPDSCIVNIYEQGDCIPPHIDHHDFVRPFCTVSFVSECNIVFGSNLKILGAGDFSGACVIPLPVGSVLVINGNGADVAKHCVPAVPTKRISITFRKMDENKLPFGFVQEPDLQGIQPLPYDIVDDEEAKRSIMMNTPPKRSQSHQNNRKLVDNSNNDRGSQSEPPRYNTSARNHSQQQPGTSSSRPRVRVSLGP